MIPRSFLELKLTTNLVEKKMIGYLFNFSIFSTLFEFILNGTRKLFRFFKIDIHIPVAISR